MNRMLNWVLAVSLAPALVACAGSGSKYPDQTEDGLQRIDSQRANAVYWREGATLADVVKTTVFIRDMGNFGAVNAIYATLFDGANPARSTVEVSGLPLGVNVEIEVVAAR